MTYLRLTNPDHAYFFGFFQTDGHLSRGPGRKGTASIELSRRDESILLEFVEMFAESMASRVSYRTRRTNFAQQHEGATWTAHAAEFRNELTQLGIPVGRKSTDVAPPTVAFDRQGYLRGLVDGDGSIGYSSTGRPFVSFTTASSALCRFFCQELYEVTGAHRSVARNSRDGVFNPMVMMEPAVKLAAWLYPPGCMALERKRRTAESVMTWRRPETMRALAARRSWTSDEDSIALSMPPHEAADQLGRSVQSVNVRRWRLRNGGERPTR